MVFQLSKIWLGKIFSNFGAGGRGLDLDLSIYPLTQVVETEDKLHFKGEVKAKILKSVVLQQIFIQKLISEMKGGRDWKYTFCESVLWMLLSG